MGSHDSQMGGEGDPYGRMQSMRQAEGLAGPANVRGPSGNQNDVGSSVMGECRIEPMRDERSSSRGRFGSMGPDSLENERLSSMRAPDSFGRTNPNEAPNSLGGPNSVGGQGSLGGPNPGSRGGPDSMGGPGSMGGQMGRPGYHGDRNDLDMEYDNYGGQERHEQEGGRRGLNRETAKSMAALDQRQVEGSQ